MITLTKSEMAEHLYEELGFNKREAREVVDLFFEGICTCLEGNETVKLSGFGNFELRDKPQRPGRNPKTGKAIPIPARRVATFRPGLKLKARVDAHIEAHGVPGAGDGYGLPPAGGAGGGAFLGDDGPYLGDDSE